VLWVRVLKRRWSGTLAWKWSQTNVFMNLTGAAHERGVWTGLRSERALRRTLVRRTWIPCDDARYDRYTHWSGEDCRRLYVKMPDGSFRGTGAYLCDVPTEANARLLNFGDRWKMWQSAQMAWYAEHRWAVENEQARDEVDNARESLKDAWWRYSAEPVE
jgi:hypothetical protein